MTERRWFRKVTVEEDGGLVPRRGTKVLRELRLDGKKAIIYTARCRDSKNDTAKYPKCKTYRVASRYNERIRTLGKFKTCEQGACSEMLEEVKYDR